MSQVTRCDYQLNFNLIRGVTPFCSQIQEATDWVDSCNDGINTNPYEIIFSNCFQSNEQYIFEVTITNYIGGTLNVFFDNNPIGVINSNGKHSFFINNPGNPSSSFKMEPDTGDVFEGCVSFEYFQLIDFREESKITSIKINGVEVPVDIPLDSTNEEVAAAILSATGYNADVSIVDTDMTIRFYGIDAVINEATVDGTYVYLFEQTNCRVFTEDSLGCNYSFTGLSGISDYFSGIVINGQLYQLPSPIHINDNVSINTFLNALNLGTFTFDTSSGYNVQSLNNPNIVQYFIIINENNEEVIKNFIQSGCIYPVYGCTDILADNYNPLANVDDGSCQYDTIPVGCTDKEAINYDPKAIRDDGSCYYEPQSPLEKLRCCIGKLSEKVAKAKMAGDKLPCCSLKKIAYLNSAYEIIKKHKTKNTELYSILSENIEEITPTQLSNTKANATFDTIWVHGYGDTIIEVYVNGQYITNGIGVTNGSSDLAQLIADTVNADNKLHEITAIPTVNSVIIETRDVVNSYGTGFNNSGAYRNGQGVRIDITVMYDVDECDYYGVDKYTSGLYINGVVVNGSPIYFPYPIHAPDSWPFGHPFYTMGIQYQLDQIFVTGTVKYNYDAGSGSIELIGIRQTDIIEELIFTFPSDTTMDYNMPIFPSNCGGYHTESASTKFGPPEFQGGIYNYGAGECSYKIRIPYSNDLENNDPLPNNTVWKGIVIDGTKYTAGPWNIYTQTQLIEDYINNLGFGEFKINNVSDFECEFIGYENRIPMIMILNVDNYDWNHPFEVNSCLLRSIVEIPVLMDESEMCLTDEEILSIETSALEMCNECCN